MLMRSCIRRLFSYSVLALIVAAILLPLSGAANARSPKPGLYSIFGETVAADPGEDPHLKVDPEFTRDFDTGSSSSTYLSGDCEKTGGRRETGYLAGAGRSRVTNKLLLTLQIFFGPLLK
jgi:hypothetical protein